MYIHIYIYICTKPRNKSRAYAAFLKKMKNGQETIDIPSDFDKVL